MTNRKLKQQLKRLWEQMPSLSQEKEDYIRQRLMSRIKFEQFNQEPQSFYYLTFKDFIRDLLHPWRIAQSFGAVALSLVLIAALGIGAVSAQFAKPGDALYGVKITMERAPLVLPASIMSDQAKAEKEMALAQNRQKEIEAVVRSQSNSQAKSKKIKAAAVELSRNIESAKARVEQISQKADKQSVIAAANAFKDSVSEIKKSLDAVAQKIKDADIDSNASDNIKEIMQKASQAELSTLGVLIATVVGKDSNDQVAQGNVQDQNIKSQEASDQVEFKQEKIVNAEEQKSAADKESADKGTEFNPKIVQDASEIVQDASEIIGTEIINDNPAVAAGGEVKDQIIKDLEQAIAELEKSLVSDKKVIADKSQNTDQEEIVSDAKEADKNETAKVELQAQAQNKTSEVVLNVAEVIEKEMLARQAAKQKAFIMKLIDDARQSLEAEDLPGALANIEEARKILGN